MLLPGQVGDRTGHFQHAAVGAHAHAHAIHRHVQHLGGLRGQGAIAAAEARVQLGVAVDAIQPVAGLLDFPGAAYPLRYLGGGLGRPGLVDFLHGHRVHLDLNVDAVQQQAGHPVEVAADFVLGAAAGPLLAAVIAAGLCCVY